MTQATHENPLLWKTDRPLPRHVAIIGAGTIGPDIGYYLKSQITPLRLTLVDIAQPALDQAVARIEAYARKGVARGKLTASAADDAVKDIVATQDYGALSDADWVIEAATEDLSLKQQIFELVETHVSTSTLLTSNTSSLPAERIFGGLKHPQRATVTHFFAPAFSNPIVEVIDWQALDAANLAYLRWLFAATGKVPMVTADVVCFMLDRIFDNWCNEAGLLLECANAAEIDSVAHEWVHAGPFHVLNMANGNPIIIETNRLQAQTEGDHYLPASIFSSVEQWLTVAPGTSLSVDSAKQEKIGARLLGILLSESLNILDRKIGSPADLELGSRLAFGFRNGPLQLLRENPDRAQQVLNKLALERPGMPKPKRSLTSYAIDQEFVLCDDVDGVKVITLRRPEALNALHDQSNDEILALLQKHEEDDATRGFVITGYGNRAFCSGADLGRFPDVLGDAEAATDYARACSRVLVHLDKMQKTVVAALNGLTLGGGLELAMRCHGLVAVEEARLQLPEITLGIAPGIGAMVVPFRRWPGASAAVLDMLFSGRSMNATTALQFGMLDRIVARPEDLLPAAIDLVTGIDPRQRRASEPPVALAPVTPNGYAASGQQLSAEVISIVQQGVVDAAGAPSLEQALEIGYRCFAKTACTQAAFEGIHAFLSGGTPDFNKTG